MSTLGLLAILKLTCSDVELGSLKIKKGGKYSEKPHETVLLQTKLVAELASFLSAQAKPVVAHDDAEYGDYGDDIDDSYGT